LKYITLISFIEKDKEYLTNGIIDKSYS